MAIIKAIQYLGFTPYWWIIKEAREDRLNNITTAVLCLFADPSVQANNPNGYIPGLFPSCTVSGTGLTNDQLITAFLTQNSNNPDWTASTDTDGSYNLVQQTSQVVEQISNDPISGAFRFATLVDYRHFCENNIIVMNLRITFDTITTTTTTNPDGSITITQNPINTDITKFVADPTKTKIIPWVVDDFNKIPNVTPVIGEASYFLSECPTAFWNIFKSGITYGDQMGYINNKLI